MIQLDFKPDHRKLRQFSWAGAIALALIGVLHAFSADGVHAGWVYWVIGGLLMISGLTAPALLRWPFIILSILIFPIGFILSHLILAFIFYGLFTPLALWFRMIGRDALRQKWKPDTDTYWIKRKAQRPPEDYYRQF